jgi:enoyl-CoA hydratase
VEAEAVDVIRRLADTTLVSIAALSGEVVGSALRLALACTMRVAAPDTVFRVTDVVGGLVPPPDVLAALQSVLGAAGALELAVTARPLGADEAAARGLALTGSSGDARDLAAAILAAPDEAVRSTVALLRTRPRGRGTVEHARSPAMLHDR